ncbi:hypothetical protein [Natrinema ejinorense]|nr:hypothetical protein [Natrinema ejinorense]
MQTSVTVSMWKQLHFRMILLDPQFDDVEKDTVRLEKRQENDLGQVGEWAEVQSWTLEEM